MQPIVVYSIIGVLAVIVALVVRRMRRRMRRAVHAFDLAWDLVLNHTDKLGEQEQTTVRVVRKRLSEEDLEEIRLELKAQEDASRSQGTWEAQLAFLRRAIMEEVDTVKLEEAYMSLDDDTRALIERTHGEGMSAGASAVCYFVALLKVTVLRYVTWFRWDDFVPNDWYTFYCKLSAKRQESYVSRMKCYAHARSTAVETLFLKKWDESLNVWRERLLAWLPGTQLPEEFASVLQPDESDDDSANGSENAQ